MLREISTCELLVFLSLELIERFFENDNLYLSFYHLTNAFGDIYFPSERIDEKISVEDNKDHSLVYASEYLNMIYARCSTGKEMMQNKGQAAMDFMMTYGWALLIILVALGAISFYFLRGSSFAPDLCVLIPGLGCSNAVAYQDSLRFTVTNGMGQDLTQLQISAEGCSVASASSSLSNGEQKVFTLSGCSHSPQDVARHSLFVDYVPKGSTLSHSRDGDFQGVAEGGCLQTYCTSGGGPGSGGEYTPDGATTLLYHFDEPEGEQVLDSGGGNYHGTYTNNNLMALYHFDENGGTSTQDSSGNDHEGTLENGAGWVSGTSGSGVYFDGVDDDVTVPSSPSLNPSQYLTVEQWVNADDPASPSNHYTVQRASGTWGTFLSSPPNQIQFYVDTSATVGGAWKSVSGTLTSGWHHVLGTYDGVNLRLYIDGSQVNSASQTKNIDQPDLFPLLFGKDISGFPFKGSLDEVVLLSRYVDSWEAQERYLASRALGDRVPGKYDTALHFDGIDDSVNVGNPSALNFGETTDFTIEGWIRTTMSNKEAVFINKYAGGLVPGYFVKMTTGGQLQYKVGDGPNSILGTSTAQINDGAWHHFAVSFDRDGFVSMFVDGAKQPSQNSMASIGNVDTTQSFFLGRGVEFFRGALDEIRISNTLRY